MINKTDFTNWQKEPENSLTTFSRSSPNLSLLRDYIIKAWGGASLGIYGVRPVRGAPTPWSSHSFGAALDWSYRGLYDNANVTSGQDHANLYSQWLIDNSKELGIQAIHDYINSRIWRSLRVGGSSGWLGQKKDAEGMGQTWGNWLHIEVSKSSWALNTPIAQRLQAAPAAPVPQRPALFYGMPRNDLVVALQDFLKEKMNQDIGNSDGQFGGRTLKGFQNFRAWVAGAGHPITLDDRVDGVDWDYLAVYDGGWGRWYAAGFPH